MTLPRRPFILRGKVALLLVPIFSITSILNSCSSGLSGGYGAYPGASYSDYSSYSDYGSFGRELPHSPGYKVVKTKPVIVPTKTIKPPSSSSYKTKTKNILGHTAGPKNFSTVIIDAGHGGKDPGATVSGIKEKTLALDVARRLQKKLKQSFKTVLIRRGDSTISLDSRVNYSHKYDDAVLVSIHFNHLKSSSVRGPETYYFRVDSYSLAKRMQKAMEAVSPRNNSRGLVRRRLRLTRNPQIPCVLVELGYLSNYSERRLLTQSSYRDKMASALAKALIDQNQYGDKGMGKLPAPLNRPLSRPHDSSSL